MIFQYQKVFSTSRSRRRHLNNGSRRRPRAVRHLHHKSRRYDTRVGNNASCKTEIILPIFPVLSSEQLNRQGSANPYFSARSLPGPLATPQQHAVTRVQISLLKEKCNLFGWMTLARHAMFFKMVAFCAFL